VMPTSLRRLPDKNAVLVRRAEINIDAFDPVAFEAEKLGISKALAAFGHAFVGHKGLIAFDEDFFQLMPLDPVAATPAVREIGRLVDLVIIRTGEAEIVG